MRAHGTIALFVKRHQNNWRITLDFKSQWQLQDNYPKWCNCHGFSEGGRTYAVFGPLSLHATRKTGLRIVRGNSTEESICILCPMPHTASNQSLSEKWSPRSCLSPSGPPPHPCLDHSKMCYSQLFHSASVWISIQA